MRRVLVALLVLAAAPLARAQTPEDRAYVAAREQAVAALEARYKSLPSPIDETAWNREERAVEGELKAELQGVLARFPLAKDFSVFGFHPDPVCCGTAARSLDGLVLSNGCADLTYPQVMVRVIGPRASCALMIKRIHMRA